MSEVERSLATLRIRLSRTEATSVEEATRRKASRGRDWQEYYVVDVVALGDLADIVVRFIEESDQEYRVRVGLLDEDGAAKPWTVAGTYLESFLRTNEHLEPQTFVERTGNVLIVDGSEIL